MDKMNDVNKQFVIGVDVGGTNTDTAVLHEGNVIGFAKRPTTSDKTDGVINSIQAALDSLTAQIRDNLSTRNVRVAIGTTHFTNAVIERDQKNLSQVAVIRLCGTATSSLPPFIDVPQDLSEIINGGYYLVSGGMEYDTKEISAINEDEIRECVASSLTRNSQIVNFVICGVFSPCSDPEHNQEIKVAAIVKNECQKRGVECSYTLSHEFGTLGLLERENAAILNEALKSMASRTIDAFGEALNQLKLCTSRENFYLTQNDGTLISALEAKQYPVLTFSSGPTNSMRGAAFLTRLLNAVVVDIGGTTSDVGVLVNGFPRQASTQCVVGGVKTNFPMPDVQSIGLGGGSLVNFNPQSGHANVGPTSVGYEITRKALCFGGKQCTATDIAIAAGVAPSNFCKTPKAVSELSPLLVAAAMDDMKIKLENIIDSMKTENERCPIILVGGGSILVDRNTPLKGVSSIECPSQHFGVANAVGAALGTVGGNSDRIVNLAPIRDYLMASDNSLDQESGTKKAREVALKKGRELAMEEVKNKGGIANTIYIHSEAVTDVTYVMDHVRVQVKAIGALTQDLLKTAAQPYDVNMSAPSTDSDIKMEMKDQKQTTEFTPNIPEVAGYNDLWPSASEEELKKDISAGLPTPLVNKDTGVWTLLEHDVLCLATGAAILGCGGGGSPYFGQLRAAQLIKSGKSIKILNPYKFQQSEGGLFCGVGFMGAPAILVEKPPNGRETSLALDVIRRVLACGVCKSVESGNASSRDVKVIQETHTWVDGTQFTGSFARTGSLNSVSVMNVSKEQRIVGLICLEAGGFNSIEPLLVGALEGLPVLDVDGMGRAFPELQMFIPFINGSRHTPSALAGNSGESVACIDIESSKDLENFFRLETVKMGISAAVAMGVMNYDEMMSKCVLLTMSKAWQLGRAVLRARATHTNVIRAVVDMQHGLTLLIGKVINVHRVTKDGFSTMEIIVEGLDDYAGRQLRVLAKNENYIAQRMINGVPHEVLACTPDLITIIDSNSGDAITTELIRYGLRVGVVVLPANHMLKTKQALKFVGPAAFGFDIPYQEPKTFS